MNKTTALALLATLFSYMAPAAAQFRYTPKDKEQVGLYLGGQFWQSNAGGSLGQAAAQVDVALKDERQLSYFVAVQHPYTWLPHVRIATTSLDTTGQTKLSEALAFADKTFAKGDAIETQFAVSFVDYTMYYELFYSKDVSVKLGLSARDFNGAVTLKKVKTTTDDTCNDPDPVNDNNCSTSGAGTAVSGQISTDGITSMVYIDTQMRVLGTNASVFATADYAVLQDHSLADYQTGVRYDLTTTLKLDTHAIIGYRVLQLQFEDLHKLYTDLEFKGAFVGMTMHF